jgi:hypothetical protein
MVGGAADDGIDILLIQTFPPVHVVLGIGKGLRRFRQRSFINVAQRHDVFIVNGSKMSAASSADTDQGDIQFVAGSSGTHTSATGQDRQARTCDGARAEKIASRQGPPLSCMFFLSTSHLLTSFWNRSRKTSFIILLSPTPPIGGILPSTTGPRPTGSDVIRKKSLPYSAKGMIFSH